MRITQSTLKKYIYQESKRRDPVRIKNFRYLK